MDLLRPLCAGLVALLAACGPAQEYARDVEARLAFEPAPHVGDVRCTVELSGLDGAALPGAALELEGNMNHAGMVPVFATLAEVAPGRYEGPLSFTMGGDWFVVVRGTLADGRAVEETIDVPGVPSRGGESAAACCRVEQDAN